MLPGLFALLVGAGLGAGDPSDACASECAAEAGTDQQTCLLQCEQRDTPRRDTGATRWRRQEQLGGAPPGSPHEGEAESVTTTTTTSADGTSTTTTKSTGGKGTTTRAGLPAAAAPTTKRATTTTALREDYPALARCMNGCDPQTDARPRAQCKLGCLQLSMHWRPRKPSATP